MRIWHVENQFGLENLRLAERSKKPLGSHEVAIKVHACSLNYRDLMVIKGQYNPHLSFPFAPVSDGAGEVIEVGDQVTQFKVGDRVCATFSQNWEHGFADDAAFDNCLGTPLEGMLKESAVCNERGLVQIPKHLTYEQAATLPCAAVTAFNAIAVQSNPLPGQSILIEGTGGVSLFALQFAKIFGMKVIILSSSDEKLEHAKELGADVCINYRDTPKWSKHVREASNNKGVDMVIEVGGAETLPQAIECTSRGGVINLIGILSGVENRFNLIPILMNNIRIQGIFVGARSVFTAMNRVIEHSKLVPIVDKVFDFADAKAAFEYMEAGKHFGKVVVKVS